MILYSFINAGLVAAQVLIPSPSRQRALLTSCLGSNLIAGMRVKTKGADDVGDRPHRLLSLFGRGHSRQPMVELLRASSCVGSTGCPQRDAILPWIPVYSPKPPMMERMPWY